jgi:hypothetical protein
MCVWFTERECSCVCGWCTERECSCARGHSLCVCVCVCVFVCSCVCGWYLVQHCAHLRVIVGELFVEIGEHRAQQISVNIMLTHVPTLPCSSCEVLVRRGRPHSRVLLLRTPSTTCFLMRALAAPFSYAITTTAVIRRSPRVQPSVKRDNFLAQRVFLFFCLFGKLPRLLCRRRCLCVHTSVKRDLH